MIIIMQVSTVDPASAAESTVPNVRQYSNERNSTSHPHMAGSGLAAKLAIPARTGSSKSPEAPGIRAMEGCPVGEFSHSGACPALTCESRSSPCDWSASLGGRDAFCDVIGLQDTVDRRPELPFIQQARNFGRRT